VCPHHTVPALCVSMLYEAHVALLLLDRCTEQHGLPVRSMRRCTGSLQVTPLQEFFRRV